MSCSNAAELGSLWNLLDLPGGKWALSRIHHSCFTHIVRTKHVQPKPVNMAGARMITLKYTDLLAGADLTAEVAAAFGYDGLGILAVEGVPDFADQRRKLLPLGRRFATMPEEIKALYEHPTSFYSFGWSHGKEKLQGD
jgi:hypothetical protein